MTPEEKIEVALEQLAKTTTQALEGARRTQIATAVLREIVRREDSPALVLGDRARETAQEDARVAVIYADALIAELDKP